MTIRLVLLLLMAGCCNTPVHTRIDIPPRPVIAPLDAELQATIPKHVKQIIGENYALWQEHIKKLESRIALHDGSLDGRNDD